MSLRAAVVVTGTEVLTGIISDANGPWVSQKLRELGATVAQVSVVGDRRDDLRAVLEFLAAQQVDLIVTSGGLGPTADDLTAEVVADFTGRNMALDEALEQRIWTILERLSRGMRGVDEQAMRAGNRKQAIIPEGADILEPVGTAPGLVVQSTQPGRPTVIVLPGPPRELQPMWREALNTEAVRSVLARAEPLERRFMRLFGIPEAELARSLRELEGTGISFDGLEVTTCLRRGEIEIATLFRLQAAETYRSFAAALAARHGDVLFSPDGKTVDDKVAELLSDRSIATAESCTGGMLAARLTDRPGSSAYVFGGLVVYANEAKIALAGVPPELLADHGAVSVQVAGALADAARTRFDAAVGVGITGVAGPGGGSENKPVGTVCLSAALEDRRIDRTVRLPGERAMIRERSTTVAMHMVRRLLEGHDDVPGR